MPTSDAPRSLVAAEGRGFEAARRQTVCETRVGLTYSGPPERNGVHVPVYTQEPRAAAPLSQWSIQKTLPREEERY